MQVFVRFSLPVVRHTLPNEICLQNQIALLQRVSSVTHQVLSDAESFLCDRELSDLSRLYVANLEKRRLDIGFNIFELVSDHYYRETFHSDIFHALLDPAGKHCAGNLYLHLFLKFIRARGAVIKVSNYKDAQVEKEQGRLDILIFGKTSKKAIIIENKINEAADMPRQLPRYLKDVKARGYTCDAIIYLRLNGHTGPDTAGWTEEERAQVKDLLTVISAYQETETDLLNGWIRKCESASTPSDTQCILRQYGDLIKKLGGNIMNKPIMEKFYRMIVQSENLKTALSLKAMLDELILYRVEKIIERFKNDLDPFHRISNWKDADAYFTDLFWREAHLGIDVFVEPESYVFQFWDRNDDKGNGIHAEAILKQMGCLDQYVRDSGRFNKTFAFPLQEEALIEHISSFKHKLRDIVVAAPSRTR